MVAASARLAAAALAASALVSLRAFDPKPSNLATRAPQALGWLFFEGGRARVGGKAVARFRIEKSAAGLWGGAGRAQARSWDREGGDVIGLAKLRFSSLPSPCG